MRIVMVGAGALGGLFAHHMALGGAQVSVVDTWDEHVAAIRDNGLRLRIGGEIVTSPVRDATTSVQGMAPAEVMVLFCKTWASETALRSAAPLVGPGTVIVTLQNGVGNVEKVKSVYPDNPVIYGLSSLTSDVLGPGLIEPRSTTAGVTDLWLTDMAAMPVLDALVDLLDKGGLAARKTPDIEHSIWKKLVINCALNGLCACLRLTCGQIVAREDIWPLLDAISDEIAAVATARGTPLDPEEARSFLRLVVEASRAHYPSMVSDVEARRPTEIESMNAAVVREGARLAVPTPANAMVAALVHAVEANYGHRPH